MADASIPNLPISLRLPATIVTALDAARQWRDPGSGLLIEVSRQQLITSILERWAQESSAATTVEPTQEP